jgi:hypothetical protein
LQTIRSFGPDRTAMVVLGLHQQQRRRCWLSGLVAAWSMTRLPASRAASGPLPANAAPTPPPPGDRLAHNTVLLHLHTPRRWPTPHTNQDATTWLRVTLTNNTGQPLRFALLDSLQPTLAVAEVAGPVPLQHGRDGLLRGISLTDTLPPGASHVSRHRVVLRRMPTGVQVRIDDGFGGWWWSKPLPPGHWRLSMVMDHAAATTNTPTVGAPIWSGHIQGPSVPVLL